MNLYDIAQEYKEALHNLEDLELPEEAIRDTLEGLQGELKQKCESVTAFRQNLVALAEAKKEASKRLNDQAKALETRADRIMDYLDFNLKKAKIKYLDLTYFSLKYRKNPPSVKVLDESLIPDRFKIKQTVVTLDKRSIKDSLKAYGKVPGAELEQREKLVIK